MKERKSMMMYGYEYDMDRPHILLRHFAIFTRKGERLLGRIFAIYFAIVDMVDGHLLHYSCLGSRRKDGRYRPSYHILATNVI